MDVVQPPSREFVSQGRAGEFQPGAVEVVARARLVRPPGQGGEVLQDGQVIIQQILRLFAALLQKLLGFAPIFNLALQQLVCLEKVLLALHLLTDLFNHDQIGFPAG